MLKECIKILYLLSVCGGTSILHCCVTPKVETQEVEEKPAYYTLRVSKVIEHPLPLPNEYLIFVDWKMNTGTVVSKKGFRGWDIDHDGVFDALEILDNQGRTAAWAYDFDGDGRIDTLQSPDRDDASVMQTTFLRDGDQKKFASVVSPSSEARDPESNTTVESTPVAQTTALLGGNVLGEAVAIPDGSPLAKTMVLPLDLVAGPLLQFGH